MSAPPPPRPEGRLQQGCGPAFYPAVIGGCEWPDLSLCHPPPWKAPSTLQTWERLCLSFTLTEAAGPGGDQESVGNERESFLTSE